MKGHRSAVTGLGELTAALNKALPILVWSASSLKRTGRDASLNTDDVSSALKEETRCRSMQDVKNFEPIAFGRSPKGAFFAC